MAAPASAFRPRSTPGEPSVSISYQEVFGKGKDMRARFRGVGALFLLIAAGPAAAHHSFVTQYDADAPVTLKGIVTKVEWMNPHARFYIDVEDEDGQGVNSHLELASPTVLSRNGWARHALQEGDEVTVRG